MESLKIILLGVGAAILYGILHDQVTARVCVEYFTIGHPILIPTDSPTVLGLLWGVIATWWMGLIMGMLVALAARAGSRPRLAARDLVSPVGRLLLAMGGLALLFGVGGYLAACAGAVWLYDPLAMEIRPEKHAAFIAAGAAHLASYGSGFLGSLILGGHVWRRRILLAQGRG